MTRSILVLCGTLVGATVVGQYSPPDGTALEGIIVERYYSTDAEDAADTDGGPNLMEGSEVYRVYVDLKPGYRLETVFGNANHGLSIETTTEFWNNTDRGETTGDQIDSGRLDDNTVAIDSWLTMAAASDAHVGVLKMEDPNGSIVGGSNNDGGSNGVSAGLLINNNACSDSIALTDMDGLLDSLPPAITTVGLDLSIFDDQNGPVFSTNNGAWAVLGGVVGATAENKILIGQFTTAGAFSFELNMRVGIPDSLQCSAPNCHTFMDYYAELLPSDTAGGGVAADNKFEHPTLTFGPDSCEVTTSVSEIHSADDVLNIYPNPAHNEVIVEMSDSGGKVRVVQVLDLSGEVLYQKNGVTTDRLTIGVQDLATGTYFVEVVTGGSRSTTLFNKL